MKNITHIVQLGENLYSIAKKYNTTVKQLMELNNLHNINLHVGQTLIIGSEISQVQKTELFYEDFLKHNQGLGLLKIKTFIGNTYLPISKVKIEVYKEFKDKKQIFFTGYTGESGLIDNISLPSPSKQANYQNGASTYQIEAKHPSYEDKTIDTVYIYDGIKSIQQIEMLPKKYTAGKGEKHAD